MGIPCRLVKGKQYTGSDDVAMNYVKIDGRLLLFILSSFLDAIVAIFFYYVSSAVYILGLGQNFHFSWIFFLGWYALHEYIL